MSGDDAAHLKQPMAAIILAAGKGTRMKSDLPKVAHEIAGQPMIRWVVEAVRQSGASPIVLIIGHGADLIRDIFAGDDEDIRYAIQDEQLGTGHATLCAKDALSDFNGNVLVLAGDGPLIRLSTIQAMRGQQESTAVAATLATSVVDDPTGYGRIMRDAEGRFDAIVEHKNATPEQLQVCEVYPSYAIFDARDLFDVLDSLEPNDLTGEYYVTDVPLKLKEAGKRVEVIDAVPPEDVLSINTPEQLADVQRILESRLEAMR